MRDAQYKLLKQVCSLFDGDNYVLEKDLKATWPACPSHNAILNLVSGSYLDYNNDVHNPGYIPLPETITLVRERKRSTVLLIISVATLVVAILTLAATLLIPLL